MNMHSSEAGRPGEGEALDIEIIIEPDVVPRGSVDLRALTGGARADGRPRETTTGRLRREPALAGAALAAAPVVASVPAGDSVALAVTGALRAPELPPPAPTPPVRVDHPEVQAELAAPALPDLAPEPDSPTLAALEAAADAPMPPRPDAADAPRDGAPAAGLAGDEVPLASLGEVSAFSTLAKLLAQLLALLLGLIALYLHLMGLAPWQKPKTDEPSGPSGPTITASVPPVGTTELAPPTVATEPGPELEPELEPEPEPEPAPTVTVEPPPPAEPTLEQLRAAAANVGTQGEVDVEEERPGLLEQIESLRASAVEFLAQGKLELAETVLKELLQLSPEDGDATFRLGLVYHRKGDLDGASEHYSLAVERAPRDPRPLNNLGLIQTGRGERDVARATFSRALEVAPDDPDVLSNLAALLEAAAPTQASPLYDKALERDPRHGPARLGRARVRAAVGDRQGARADYQALVDQDGVYAPRALDGMGVLSRVEGKAEEAVALHRRALERSPAFVEARVNLGVALLDLGRDDEARKELDDAVKAQPRSARGWQALGVARARAGMLHEAKLAYESAIKLNGEDWATRYDYALCAEQFGNFLFAMREYERAIALNPAAWQPYANLSRLYLRGGQRQKAIDILERGLRASPRQLDLTFALAHAFALEGRDDEARAALRQFIAHAPQGDPRVATARKGLGG